MRLFSTSLIFLLASSIVAGCYPYRHGYSYFPSGAINQPTGTNTRHWQAAQADKAKIDGVVLYEAAWIDGSDQLGPAAKIQLTSECDPLALITLEPAQDPSLNERRIEAILDFASNRGIPLSPESIVLSHPDGNVLYGEESVQVSREMMQGNRRTRPQNTFGADAGGILGGQPFGGFPGQIAGGR